MITRLRPLDVDLVFEDRLYRLGETIRVDVDLNAKGNVLVRECRVDLVCQENWSEVFTVMVSVSRPISDGRGRAVYMPTTRVPKQVAKQHRESYVHSSAIFLENSELEPNSTGTYSIGLEIENEPPPRAKEATMRWSLVVVADVARARDIKARRAVKVAVN